MGNHLLKFVKLKSILKHADKSFLEFQVIKITQNESNSSNLYTIQNVYSGATQVLEEHKLTNDYYLIYQCSDILYQK